MNGEGRPAPDEAFRRQRPDRRVSEACRLVGLQVRPRRGQEAQSAGQPLLEPSPGPCHQTCGRAKFCARVDHRQGHVCRIGPAEPSVQIPAGVPPGLQQQPVAQDRRVLAHPPVQRRVGTLRGAQQVRGEVQFAKANASEVDHQEVHAREVPPLAVPAIVPRDSKQAQ